jgi:hypothetical protein
MQPGYSPSIAERPESPKLIPGARIIHLAKKLANLERFAVVVASL